MPASSSDNRLQSGNVVGLYYIYNINKYKGRCKLMTEEITETEEQIQAAMKQAMEANDWNQVKRLAADLDKMAKAEQAKAKAELQSKLAGITDKAKKAFDALAQKLMDTGDYDGADGFWYVKDFGDASTGMRLTKTAKRVSTGDSAGKSSYVAGFPPNKEMLDLVGDMVMFEADTTVTIDKAEHTISAGTTFKEAHDYSNNGGWRNRVRMSLGKAYTKATGDN